VIHHEDALLLTAEFKGEAGEVFDDRALRFRRTVTPR
jgi:hypothetical protein